MTNLHDRAKRYILLDHFDMVYDIEKSRGNYLFDSKHNRFLLDAFSFIASNPLGHNHPKLNDPDFEKKLLKCAKVNPSNSDILTEEYVEFLETLNRVAAPSYLQDTFLISGGTLAVENALKAAFDWKYRKLLERGISVNYNDLKILHFRNAFHGRSGYCLSLTNTADKRKYDLFPKFPNWLRLDAPVVSSSQTNEEVALADKAFVDMAYDTITRFGHEIAAIIIEPIQGEGGDNHFSRQFHQNIREIADTKEMLLIYDEVQTGVGLTGKMWAHQLYDVQPDIISFGKKMQVCGILSGPRVREVQGSVFEEKSRINSTWGGSLVDMVRATRYLEIISEDQLVENAATVGAYLLSGLCEIEKSYQTVSNARGAGLMCAFDLPTGAERDNVVKKCLENRLFLLGCGTRSVRVRPSLTFSTAEVDELLHIVRKSING